MKKYDTYKDSGIEWLGEIPEHWEISKLNYISDVYGGATPKSNVDNYWGGNINWITPDDLGKIQGKSIVFSRRTITESGLLSCSASVVPKGSIVLSSRAPIGHIGILEVDACTNQGCKAFVPNEKVQNYFLYYYLLSAKTDLQSLGTGSTFLEISTAIIKNYRIALPPYSEQISIVSFLENKTTQIDTLIEKKEQLVEKLTLKRQAIINEAVTKGLNPDVPMKDSGIEWLGEIPEHWEVVSLKYLVNHSTTKGNGKSKLKVALENIESQTGVYLESEKKEFEGELKEFKKDDILFNKLRPYLAKVFKAPEDGECVSELLVFTCLSPVLIPDFLFWKLISQQIISVVDSSTYGAKMPRVGTDFMLNLPIALPLKDEQEGIIKHIADKIKIIDATSEKAKESIEKLKLYRQSLISEAVTGKIDLRDWKQTDNK